MLVQFLVESIQTNQPAGHLICYNPDLSLGGAYVGAAMASPYLGTGIAAEPVRLFIDHLFDVWPFRTLYLEMPEFNYQQFASAGGRALQVEARLGDHDYYRSRRWDRLILAAYRLGEDVPAGTEEFSARR
jgi:RimJ/RimL family protein N-acetyltransferase